MNRYIAALTIGIGLMAHSPAFAEGLKFLEGQDAPMEECIEASKVGYEVYNFVSDNGHVRQKRYLVRGLKMGVPWRVYTLNYFFQQVTDAISISCDYRTGEKD